MITCPNVKCLNKIESVGESKKYYIYECPNCSTQIIIPKSLIPKKPTNEKPNKPSPQNRNV